MKHIDVLINSKLWEKIYSALPAIRTISRMLGWDSDRVQFLEDVISLLEIN